MTPLCPARTVFRLYKHARLYNLERPPVVAVGPHLGAPTYGDPEALYKFLLTLCDLILPPSLL